MNIEEVRPEFRVIFVDENYLNSTELYQSVVEVGYQAQFYPTFDSAMVSIRSAAPHLLVVYYSKNDLASDRFLNQVRKVSPETQIILMINETHVINSIMKNSVGEIFDYLVVPLVSSAELLICLDRASQQLYLKYENEQLRNRRQNSVLTGAALAGLNFEENESVDSLEKLQNQVQDLMLIKDQEELVKKYIFQLASSCGSMPVLYLRYLPMQSSFVHSQSIWTPLADVKNLGFKVESLRSPNELVANYAPLKEFMSQVFQIERFATFVHLENSQIKGLTIIFNKENPLQNYAAASILHAIFETLYSKNSILKELHNQQTIDGSSGLLSRKFFEEQLDLEISRSRRIHTPLSMMKLQIDNFDVLSKKYGEENITHVVKAFARSMKKNFRTIDILARVSKNEFCFLLPHTDLKNTLLKAEKIRRAFNQSQFPFLAAQDRTKLSLSIGVSEYPSLSSDAESLIKSCDEALYQVLRNHGNQVAVWQADSKFKPDFRSTTPRNAE